jgi:Uma2 family endonuclease
MLQVIMTTNLPRKLEIIDGELLGIPPSEWDYSKVADNVRRLLLLLAGGPEPAIEIVSPVETAQDLNRKVDLLLKGGSTAVWVVYPEEREVHVFSPGGNSIRKSSADSLLFENLQIPVADLFTD